jgi:hypothetical protein
MWLVRRIMTLLTVASAVTVSGVATTQPAHAFPVGQIRSVLLVDSPKCLQPEDGSAGNGARIRLQPCDGSPEQTWFRRWVRMDSMYVYYNFQNVKSTKCLDLTDGNTSTNALYQQWDCNNGTSTTMIWRVTISSFSTYLINDRSGKCVTVPAGTHANALVAQGTCSSDPTVQTWQRFAFDD